ncbi:hypothetical protein [Rhizobium leguminosarum]|uniref:hypothetical protein n=1 Tax=Rhizobium leguminosarum TaxID=384 RepID=UPI00047FFBE9|nr:hypothetical protein [Rhizobium leguminosarum]
MVKNNRDKTDQDDLKRRLKSFANKNKYHECPDTVAAYLQSLHLFQEAFEQLVVAKIEQRVERYDLDPASTIH